MEYYLHLAIISCIYLILAQALNLNFGLGGMFNLAHVACYAIGSYTTAILSVDYQYSFLVCIICSALVASLLSLILGAISLRLTLDYFAIGTLSFSFIISALLINWKELTRGVLGIPGIPRPEIYFFDLPSINQFTTLEFSNNYHFLILVFSFAVITNIIFYFIFQAPYARALRAQSEFVHASQTLAINSTAVRLWSFTISSFFAGIAGSFFAYYINYIDPSSFSLQEMLFVFSIIIVGRPGSFWGVIAATLFLVLLPEGLRFFDLPSSILGPMRQFLYAFILFTTVYINKGILFPTQRKI